MRNLTPGDEEREEEFTRRLEEIVRKMERHSDSE